MFKKILAIVIALGFLAGCNTMKGAGKDVERAGEKIQNAPIKLSNKGIVPPLA